MSSGNSQKVLLLISTTWPKQIYEYRKIKSYLSINSVKPQSPTIIQMSSFTSRISNSSNACFKKQGTFNIWWYYPQKSCVWGHRTSSLERKLISRVISVMESKFYLYNLSLYNSWTLKTSFSHEDIVTTMLWKLNKCVKIIGSEPRTSPTSYMTICPSESPTAISLPEWVHLTRLRAGLPSTEILAVGT